MKTTGNTSAFFHERSKNGTPGAILFNMLLAAVSLFVNGFGIYLTIRANLGAAPR